MRRAAWLMLLAASACGRTRVVPVEVAVCGALSGDGSPVAADDFTDVMACATAVRVRLLATDGAALGDRCLGLVPDSTTGAPAPARLADLFATSASTGDGAKLSLGELDPAIPFAAEIAIYGPGATPCADGAPVIALGRSALVDLRRDSGPIAVPLGCRSACNERSEISLEASRLESGAVISPPAIADFGEIFPYGALVSTAGLCMAPPQKAHRGQFRSFGAVEDVPGHVAGRFGWDHSRLGGCVAARIESPAGATFACLGALTKETAPIAILDDAHLAALIALDPPAAENGVLAIKVVEPDGVTPSEGAVVTFDFFEGANGADYVRDAAFTVAPPDAAHPGTLAAGSGLAIFTNANTGSYTVTFADRTTRSFNAGGADIAQGPSVTTVTVAK
jgi:hypothetical protein